MKEQDVLKYPSRFYIGYNDYLAILEMFYDDICLWGKINHKVLKEMQIKCRGWEGVDSVMTIHYEVRRRFGQYQPYPQISVFPIEGNAILSKKDSRLSEMGINHLILNVYKGRRKDKVLLFPLKEGL